MSLFYSATYVSSPKSNNCIYYNYNNKSKNKNNRYKKYKKIIINY